MKRLIPFVLLLCACATSQAAPPYISTVSVITPGAVDAGHAAATHFDIYTGCQSGGTKVLLGTVTASGQVAGNLTTAGTYTFCARARNADGQSVGYSPNYTQVINELARPPNNPLNLTITIQCDNCTAIGSPGP